MKKATIVEVGTIDENDQPKGWVFNCHGDDDIPAFNFTDDGVFYAGYSLDELREIAKVDAVVH